MKLIGRDQVIRCTHCGQRLGPGDAHFCPVTSTEMYFAPDPIRNTTIQIPPGYEAWARVIQGALNQVANGKGKERHANDEPFDQQTICQTARHHGVGFVTGQAEKKGREQHRLPKDRAIAELEGAINYLVAAIIVRGES